MGAGYSVSSIPKTKTTTENTEATERKEGMAAFTCRERLSRIDSGLVREFPSTQNPDEPFVRPREVLFPIVVASQLIVTLPMNLWLLLLVCVGVDSVGAIVGPRHLKENRQDQNCSEKHAALHGDVPIESFSDRDHVSSSIMVNWLSVTFPRHLVAMPRFVEGREVVRIPLSKGDLL